MNAVWLEGVAFIGPGLPDWHSARAVLGGAALFQDAVVPSLKPQVLPANERRRATALIRLAVSLAEEAVRDSVHPPDSVATVFSSIEGDRDMADSICRALSESGKPVSPTHFHNSVHNAAAGYWAIASGSRQCSTSVAAGKDSFALGLIEAATIARSNMSPVLLIACDTAAPAAIQGLGYVETTLGCALLLSPKPGPAALCALELDLVEGRAEEHPISEWTTALIETNPQARSLVLLQPIAQETRGEVGFAVGEAMTLRVTVAGC